MTEKAERIEIGCSGGQVAAVRVSGEALSAFRAALAKDEGWHELDADDSALSIDLGSVSFVRVQRDEQSIGFSGA